MCQGQMAVRWGGCYGYHFFNSLWFLNNEFDILKIELTRLSRAGAGVALIHNPLSLSSSYCLSTQKATQVVLKLVNW